jgi:soluble lytic murein transglycosylase-like protein
MTAAVRRLLAAWLLGAGLASLAHADVWGYVDEKGVAHFSVERLDERYQLFFRGGESFDTARGMATPRPVSVPTAQPRLLAFFEIAPGFRQVRHHLREAASSNGIDYELLQALIATESGFDSGAVSPRGAIGLMQVMPATALRFGVAGDRNGPVESKLADPRTNIRAGSRYLAYLLKMYPGQTELALAAYNAGEGAVQKAGNRIPNFRETQNYVKTVMQLYGLLKPPSMQRTGAVARVPARIQMEFPGLAGGAQGRGNLPAGMPLAAATVQVPGDRE